MNLRFVDPTSPEMSHVKRPSQPELLEILDEFVERTQRGEPVDIDAFVRGFPEHAESLREYLESLLFLQRMAPDVAAVEGHLDGCADWSGRTLGEFRILGEVGRGGMGVVYEALQETLGRRVALKVLPFAAVLDQQQIKRFSLEAQAAAQLHHVNIVPVYSVGCEKGVHFYSMQFIDGQSLDVAIEDLQRFRERCITRTN